MPLALILLIGAVIVLAWLFLWVFQRERLDNAISTEASYTTLPLVGQRDGVLIVDQRGRLVYTNETLRSWVKNPNLTTETLAGSAQPVDVFFELLARDGQATFQIAGRWLQGESRRVIEKGEPRTVVVLRDVANTGDVGSYDPQRAISIINEIGETINASLGVEPVLQALLTIVRKYIPADAGEITLWDERSQCLTPRGWVGDSMYVLALAEAGGFYQLGEGISGWVARTRQPALVVDSSAVDAVRPKLNDRSPYRSYIAIPLVMGERFLGTFELASSKAGAFDSARLALLQNVGRPVATAITNAELYAQQTARIAEISDLQAIVDQTALVQAPEQVFGALAERTARLLEAQIAGVLVFDERRERLVPQPPFFGLPPVIVRNLVMTVRAGTPAHSIWAERDYWLSSDLSDEPAAEDLGLALLYNSAGVRNALLMPLVVGIRRVGLLMALNKSGPSGFSAAGFSDSDARTLRPLAAQIAIALENVRLADQEAIRQTELAGLQEISQVFSVMGHTDQFYASITERLARLMHVEVCGVLLLDAEGHALVPQLPFFGMDAADYAIDLPEGSPMAMVYHDEDFWYTNNASTDRLIYSAGLAEAVAVAQIYRTLFASLPAAGQNIGIIQVANPRDGRDFSDDDARLLQVYAAQVGTMIENARLFRAVQAQVDVSESIRRIAEYAGAVNTPEDSFEPLLREVARLTVSPASFVTVMNPETGKLITRPDLIFNISLPAGLASEAYSKGFEPAAAFGRRPFISTDLPNTEDIAPDYKPFAEALGVRSIILVGLTVGEQLLGELGVMNRQSPAYADDDLRTLQAVAVHFAAALDRVRLAQVTGQNMRRRLQELDAISRVSNELAQTLDLDQTLGVILQEALRALEATGSIGLFRSPDEWRSEGQPLLERRLGERITGLAPIEALASRSTRAIVVDDYGAAGAPKAAPLEARSAVAVSFAYEQNVVGVIHLWDARPNHFDATAGTFLETLAAKASLSFGNNRRYLDNQERSNRLARRVEQLNQIFELGQVLQYSTDTVSMLEAIAFSVGQSIGFDIVVMLMFDPETRALRRITQAGLPLDAFQKSLTLSMSEANWEKLRAKEEFRISESYFFPINKLTDWYVEGMEVFGSAIAITRTMHPRGKTDWHDGDMLLVPLNGVGGELLGIMSLDRPFDSRRPDRGMIEILEVFAHQAASTLETTRLYADSQRSAEQEVRLNQVLGAVSSSFDIQEIVRGVATGALGMVNFQRMTIALLTMGGRAFELIRVVISEGSVQVTREQRVDLAGTALGYAFETGLEHLYRDTDSSDDAAPLRDLVEWRAAGEQVSLVMPLIAGGLVLGAMHLGGTNEIAAEFEEQGGLIHRLASLTGIAVQNARLFTDTRARTERLSLLNRISIALAQSLDTENVMEIALQEIAMLLDMPISRAYLVDREAHVVRALVEFPRGDMPPEDVIGFEERPLFNQAIQSALPVLIEDVQHGNAPTLPAHLNLDDVSAYALLPMIMAGHVTGLFELTASEPSRFFEPEKLELAGIIANQAATGVLNASLLEQTLLRTRELETLLEAAQAAAYTLDLDDVLRNVTRLVLQALDLQDAAVMLHDNIEDVLDLAIEMSAEDGETINPGRQLDLRDFAAKARAIRQAQIVVVRLTDANPDPAEHDDMIAHGVRERMIVPLIVRDQVIGLMQIDLRTPFKSFSHREIRMAQSLAAQAAATIENARLSTETAAQVEQSLIINEISLGISATMDVADMVSIIRDQAANLTEANEISVALFNAETNAVSYPMVLHGGAERYVASHALGNDEVSFIIRNRRPLSLGGVSPSAEEVRRNLGIIAADTTTTRFLGVPLLAGDDVMGALVIRDSGPRRPFGLNDQRVLNAIATQLAATLQNARLFQRVRTFANELNVRVEERTRELQEERDRLESLYQITSELARSFDIDRIYVRSLEMSVRATGASTGFVILLDEAHDRLYTRSALIGGEGQTVRVAGSGMTEALDATHIARAPAESYALWLMQHERSSLIEDLHAMPFWDRNWPGAEGWRSALGVVLESNDDVLGVIVLFGSEIGQFKVPQLRLVLAAAGQITAAVNNAELYTLIREQNDRMTALLRAEKEEAQKNSAILEGIADGVLLANADGRVLLFNGAAETILDIPRVVAMGQTLDTLGNQYPNAYRWVSRLSSWSNDARRTPELTIDRLEIGPRVVSVRAGAVFMGQQALGTVSVFRDVTREVELDRMKSEFISNVSHELRTPMTSIMGYAELLLSGAAGQQSDVQKRFLQTIKGNADRLSSLVNDLLNISRIDSGRDRLNLQNLDMGDVINQMAEIARARAQNVDKQIALSITLEPGLPLIRADRLKMEQIIGNIIDNAYNYTRAGGQIAVKAHTRVVNSKSQVLITVADTGIGIPEEFHQRIFNRFERYDENALVMDIAGTGLGLSIVKALVEMHEGEVWFDSTVGVGTTFFVALPVEGPRAAGLAELPSGAAPGAAPNPQA